MSEKILNTIKSPEDIKRLDDKQINNLCKEIRKELINTVSENGGHLASNLGAVELTVALHKNFNFPKDKLVFDVGHQCYVHKMLTGRLDKMNTLRKKGGISGFPRPDESEYDSFIAGHSSTSVSAGFGIAEAKREKHDNSYVVVVVGDGAISGGLIYEGLNNAGRSEDKLIVILNDNKMSISENVGAMSRYLAEVRSDRRYHSFKVGIEKILVHIPLIGKELVRIAVKFKKVLKGMFFKSSIFEDLGFSYLGPIDGHNIEKLDYMIKLAKNEQKPVLLHINTVKGKGYSLAEKNPNIFHGIGPFDIKSGKTEASSESFSDEFGKAIISFAENDKRICAITAAMRESTGLNEFSEKFKSRFYDVGIAEGHAVTFAGGLAAGGMIPIFAVYSTFLQRAYDMIIHDVALQNLKVIFCIDRAGIVGADGETHQGVFDVSFLNAIPNITIYSPATFAELRYDLKCAIYNDEGVVAIRYSRGKEADLGVSLENGDYNLLGNTDSENCIITYGRITENVLNAAEKAINKPKIIKVNKIKPINPEIIEIAKKSKNIYIYEEGMRSGGFAESLSTKLYESGYKGNIDITAIDGFIPHSSVDEALKDLGFDSESILKKLQGEV